MGQESIQLVLEKTLFPEGNYTGVMRDLQSRLPHTMNIDPSGAVQLPEFPVDGYNVSICPGRYFDRVLPPKTLELRYKVSNPWYKPLEEVIGEMHQPLTLAEIIGDGTRKLSYILFKDLLGVLHRNGADFEEIHNGIQLFVTPGGEEEVFSAHINARTLNTLASVGVVYYSQQRKPLAEDSERHPHLRVFYANHGHTRGEQARVQDLLIFEALFSTLVRNSDL